VALSASLREVKDVKPHRPGRRFQVATVTVPNGSEKVHRGRKPLRQHVANLVLSHCMENYKALGKRSLADSENWHSAGAITGLETATIGVAVLLILLQYRINPALLVLGGAIIGALSFGPK